MTFPRLAAFLGLLLCLGCAPPKHSTFNNVTATELKAEQLKPLFDHPENIDYKTIKKEVIALCMKCHSLDSEFKDINAITYSANMTSYASLFNPFTPIIIKGSPMDSKLFQAIALTQSMPPLKAGYDPLDGLRLKLIRLWIMNCAIEDKQALGEEVLTPDPENPDKVRHCD